MRVIAVDQPHEMALLVAGLVERAAPSVLGVATGSSPVGSYVELVQRRSLCPDVQICLLDEYVGLPVGHPMRYRSVIIEQLTAPLGLPDDQLHSPDVDSPDLNRAAADYETLIDELGGIDVQILGIGRNGHIGFNEPGTPFTIGTHAASLSESTRGDNAHFFESIDHVPRHVITQGLRTISAARRIVLIAAGHAKADAMSALLDRPPTTDVPASALADHPDFTVVADRAALRLTTTQPRQESR